jgi:hypothetical protein
LGPVKVSLREELIFLLNQAAELEHSLCCSYFFTALSLKAGVEEGLTEETLPKVKRWKRVFTDIAIEEMMHLAVVNNLLIAVGAPPHFDRPNFPHDCAYYMPHLEIGLRAFSEETLNHFIAIEQPAGVTLPFAPTSLPTAGVQGDLENEIGPDPHRLDSQGEIYTLIADGPTYLSERLGEENLFIGPPMRPAVKDFFSMAGWGVINDLDTAIKALDHVVEQGEGGSSVSANSHHARFLGVLDEYIALKAEDPTFDPTRPLLRNPFTRTPPEAQGSVNLITDEFAIQVSDLFNEAYVTMLNLTGRFFVTTEETESEAMTLGDAAIEVMRGAMLPLGELLARLPADTTSDSNAGPSFVVRTLHALPHKKAAWYVMRERVDELRDYSTELAARGREQAVLDKAAASFGRVAKMLS